MVVSTVVCGHTFIQSWNTKTGPLNFIYWNQFLNTLAFSYCFCQLFTGQLKQQWNIQRNQLLPVFRWVSSTSFLVYPFVYQVYILNPAAVLHIFVAFYNHFTIFWYGVLLKTKEASFASISFEFKYNKMTSELKIFNHLSYHLSCWSSCK